MAFNPLCLPPERMNEISILIKCLKFECSITRDRNDGSYVFYYPQNDGNIPKRFVVKNYEALIRQLKFIIEEEKTDV